ncbi:MAG: response regulator transcription factor [Tenuifilaceae bacterium]|nr:response regulator transcription factor [Tenuifilaceae bacterium]
MIRVAIVEDNQEICTGISSLLNLTEGYECVAAFSNAEDAIITIPTIQPDVALIDINLPGKNGIELIGELKPLNPNIQFVVFTVFEDTDRIFAALKAGASGYLLKSSSPQKIIEAIAEVNQGGSPMSGSIARKVISTFYPTPQANDENSPKLSTREHEILTLLSKGFRYKEIAYKLNISTETVRTHIRNIYQKLQVESSIEAINKVFRKYY